MGKNVTINGTTYTIPDVGEENYGEELQEFLLEIVNVLNTVSAPLDISKTDFNFLNNNSTPAPITGLIFPTADVTKFKVEYLIQRTSPTENYTESGKLVGYQNATGWELSRVDVQNNIPDIGVEFLIDNSGQILYTSTNLPAQELGLISYKATTLTQD
jgi:hypothetical protein